MKTARLPLLFFAALHAAAARAAPITFDTALPVHEGGLLFRGQGSWMRMRGDPSPMGREMDVAAAASVLVYGATSKLALMGVFPYLDKRLEIRSTGAVREASGLGDIMTAGRYQVYESDVPGRTSRGSVFAGLQWPSGPSAASDSLGSLPPAVQLGSGAYDPLFGAVWTWQSRAFELDADALYRRNARAGNFKFGDVVQEDASLQYRLWPRALEAEGVPAYLYGVLEANSVYRAANIAGGATDPDSGGYQLFLDPGLQLVFKRVVLELAAQIPAVQSLNGTGLRANFSLVGGFRIWL